MKTFERIDHSTEPSVAEVVEHLRALARIEREERAVDFRRAVRVWSGPTVLQLSLWLVLATATVVGVIVGAVALAALWHGGPTP